MGNCVHCGKHVGNNGEGGDTCYTCDLEAENQRLQEAIRAHNAECDALCREDCIYRTTYTKTKCPDCPKDWKIEEGE